MGFTSSWHDSFRSRGEVDEYPFCIERGLDCAGDNDIAHIDTTYQATETGQGDLKGFASPEELKDKRNHQTEEDHADPERSTEISPHHPPDRGPTSCDFVHSVQIKEEDHPFEKDEKSVKPAEDSNGLMGRLPCDEEHKNQGGNTG